MFFLNETSFAPKRGVAGAFILISLAVAHYVHPNWIWSIVFVGANLLQSGIT